MSPRRFWTSTSTRSGRRLARNGHAPSIGGRSPDDFCAIVHGYHVANEAVWMRLRRRSRSRGLRRSVENSRACRIDEGFEFLGFASSGSSKWARPTHYVYTWPEEPAVEGQALCQARARADRRGRSRVGGGQLGVDQADPTPMLVACGAADLITGHSQQRTPVQNWPTTSWHSRVAKRGRRRPPDAAGGGPRRGR